MSIRSVYDLEQEIENLCGELFDNTNAIQVTYDMFNKTGLDCRAFSQGMFATSEYLAVKADRVRSLNYYGGFEYVDSEYIRELGPYVFFASESSRVAEVLERLPVDGDEYEEDEEDNDEEE